MMVRLSAVICGAAIMFVCSSAAMARTEASHAANAHDASIVGTASTYSNSSGGLAIFAAILNRELFRRDRDSSGARR